MLVYSVNSKQSFDMIRILRDKILNHLVCTDPASFPDEGDPLALGTDLILGCRLGADSDCWKQKRSQA